MSSMSLYPWLLNVPHQDWLDHRRVILKITGFCGPSSWRAEPGCCFFTRGEIRYSGVWMKDWEMDATYYVKHSIPLTPKVQQNVIFCKRPSFTTKFYLTLLVRLKLRHFPTSLALTCYNHMGTHISPGKLGPWRFMVDWRSFRVFDGLQLRGSNMFYPKVGKVKLGL